MNFMPLQPTPAPAHVPADRIFDFDFNHPEGVETDAHLAWLKVRDKAPEIFWTPRNGGHWVATRGEAIKEIQVDHSHFSHRHYSLPVHPDEIRSPGVMGFDPPEHAPYRKIIMSNFLPKKVVKLGELARELAIARIRQIAPQGECEFMEEFARYLPAAVVMDLFGLPLEDVPMLMPIADALVRARNGDEFQDSLKRMTAYLEGWIQKRLADPGDDLTSTIVTSQVNGRPLEHSEMLDLCFTLFAGLDTVASMMGFFCRFLATHPEHRRDIIEHPEIRANAVEELIRRHGITCSARYVTQDIDFHGAPLREGDMILATTLYYGLDDRIVDDPLTVNFRRERFPLATFGNGPHTCPGSVLARRELTIFLDEWLPRIPEFAIKPNTAPKIDSGAVMTIRDLNLVWDPASVRRD